MRVPVRNPAFRLERPAGGLLLFDPVEVTAIAVNEAAAMVWSLADGGRSEAEIIALLCEEYPEHAHAIEADVVEILDRLTVAGAMRVDAHAPPNPST